MLDNIVVNFALSLCFSLTHLNALFLMQQQKKLCFVSISGDSGEAGPPVSTNSYSFNFGFLIPSIALVALRLIPLLPVQLVDWTQRERCISVVYTIGIGCYACIQYIFRVASTAVTSALMHTLKSDDLLQWRELFTYTQSQTFYAVYSSIFFSSPLLSLSLVLAILSTIVGSICLYYHFYPLIYRSLPRPNVTTAKALPFLFVLYLNKYMHLASSLYGNILLLILWFH